MTNAILHRWLRRLDRRLRPSGLGAPRLEPDPPTDEARWLDQYLFDREWRWNQLWP